MSNKVPSDSLKRVFLLSFLIVCTCGLAIYLLPTVMLGITVEFTGPRHDGYLELATMLASGEGFRFEPGGDPVMHRPPLYPILLIPATFLPVGWQEMAVISLNSVLAGISCMMLMLLSIRLFGSHRVGYTAVALYLVSPWLYRLVSLPHTALLQSTLYLASAVLLLSMVFGDRHGQPLKSARFRRAALAYGAVGGLLTLTHGVGFLVFGVTWFALTVYVTLIAPRSARSGRASAMLASVCLAGVIAAPWVIRNAMVLPVTVPVTTGASFNYFMGNVYWNLGGHDNDLERSLQDNALRAGGVDKSASDAMRFWGVMDPNDESALATSMREHMLANPMTVLEKSLWSLADNFVPLTHLVYCQFREAASCAGSNVVSRLHQFGLSLYYLALIALATVAVVRGRQRGPALVMFALGGLHIGPYLPLGQWAPHGIYGLSAVLLLIVFSAASLLQVPPRSGGH